jgi:hypothetical protein
MNPLYPEMYQVALNALEEFGMDVTINRGAFVYDPVSGSRSGATSTIVKKGLNTKYFARLISDFRIIGNASTMKVDVAIMFGGDVDVKDDDTMTIDGTDYSVIQVDKIAPGGLVILQYALGRV